MGLRKFEKINLLDKNIHKDDNLTLEEYCEFLHGSNSGFVTVTTKDKKEVWSEKTYPIEDWKNHIVSDENKGCFASLATFFVPRRNTNTLREISMIYVDIDTRDAGISNEEAIEQMDFLVDMERLPQPTMIIGSGGGLYALWKIESVPGKFKRVQQLYKYVENTLIEELKDLGADDKASDATRVLRVPGSINEKYGKEVQVLRYNAENHYTLRFFQDFSNEINDIDWEEVQKEIKERKARWKAEKKARKAKNKAKKETKITRLFNRYTLAISRSKDFEKIVELRGGNLDGMANTILHMYAIEQMRIHQDKLVMKHKLQNFNDTLMNNKDKKDIQYIADSVGRNHEYWNYKNSTIIRKLSITAKEMKSMLTLIDKDEKNERDKVRKKNDRKNENGLTVREQAKVNKINAVKELKEKGYKQSEIATKLGITKGTVSKYLKA